MRKRSVDTSFELMRHVIRNINRNDQTQLFSHLNYKSCSIINRCHKMQLGVPKSGTKGCILAYFRFSHSKDVLQKFDKWLDHLRSPTIKPGRFRGARSQLTGNSYRMIKSITSVPKRRLLRRMRDDMIEKRTNFFGLTATRGIQRVHVEHRQSAAGEHDRQ